MQQLKSWLTITLVVILSIPVSADNSETNPSVTLLNSEFLDGHWVNETVVINGTTSINPQNADWVLYNVTDPYVEWPVIKSGDYFTSVYPVEENLWEWNLLIDVEGLNCTCWLEIGQPNGLGKEFLNRIIFIGSGPHNPVISPLHDEIIMLDEPVQITAKATLSDSVPSNGSIILNWCSSPNGACDGETHSANVDVDWDENIATFTLDAVELELEDGIWSFTYIFQDAYLKESPHVEIIVYVDRNEPTSAMICPSESFEGDNNLIDGSGSSDGVWSNNLQYVWYVTKPDGTVYFPQGTNTESTLNLILNDSGLHSIRLDVIDWVGRMNSTSCQIFVKNSEPLLVMEITGVDVVNPTSWQFTLGENVSLKPSVVDAGDGVESALFSWYIGTKLVGNSQEFSIADLEEGTYEMTLVVTDDDGANDSHQIEIIINAENNIENDVWNYSAVIVLIGIAGFAFVMFSRMQEKDVESKSLPKWRDKQDKSNIKPMQNDNVEKELWD